MFSERWMERPTDAQNLPSVDSRTYLYSIISAPTGPIRELVPKMLPAEPRLSKIRWFRMKTGTIVESIQRNFKNHGAAAAIYDVAIRSINKCCYVKKLTCVAIDEVNPKC